MRYLRSNRGNFDEFKTSMRAANAPCNRCGDTVKQTIMHHIDHNPQNDEWGNFEVLCISCHGRHHSTGMKHTDETKAKLRALRLGTKLSSEHKRKISAALIGNQHNLGNKHTNEARAKISTASAGHRYRTVTCPHCDKEGGVNVMKRWHFNNCTHSYNSSRKIESIVMRIIHSFGFIVPYSSCSNALFRGQSNMMVTLSW